MGPPMEGRLETELGPVSDLSDDGSGDMHLDAPPPPTLKELHAQLWSNESLSSSAAADRALVNGRVLRTINRPSGATFDTLGVSMELTTHIGGMSVPKSSYSPKEQLFVPSKGYKVSNLVPADKARFD